MSPPSTVLSGSSSHSARTLAADPAVPAEHPAAAPEKAREYRTPIDDASRAGEEAEREFASYGGDVPNDKILIRRTTRRQTRTRRNTDTSFPSLHVTDSAFSDAHRHVSRTYSRALSDHRDAVGRGPAMSIFTACVFIGPVMGPIVGGFVTTSYLGWRWIFWIMMLFAAACFLLVIPFLPETYAPVLLAHRAKAMRKADPVRNADVYAELERADFSFKPLVTRTIARPFLMLAVEPILLTSTLYLSVGVGIGTTMGALINIYVQRHYKELVPKWHNCPPPEERLWGAMLAGPFLIIGIFMLGWTGNFASIHWIVPEIAAVFLGASFTLVFISFLSYLIETYLLYAASALAASTIIRSSFGAAFPLFTNQMFAKLGVGWACSLIGLIALIIFPAPFIFYKYGSSIRDGSSFAPCLDLAMAERVEREELEEKEKVEGKAHGENV
ncbi:hypothetical protein P7C70_g5253, partial [Phenoliferia sp. Uapishka_3]